MSSTTIPKAIRDAEDLSELLALPEDEQNRALRKAVSKWIENNAQYLSRNECKDILGITEAQLNTLVSIKTKFKKFPKDTLIIFSDF